MKRLFETKYGGLCFSLLSGLAYFAVVMNFVLESTGKKGILLGIFFFPAIVCGAAYVILKSIKQLQEREEYTKITVIFVCHVILMLVGAAMLAVRL